MRLPFLPLLALACAALSGCDSLTGGAGGLDLVVDRGQYQPGEVAVAVLDNDSGRDYAYGCAQIGRFVDGAFVAVGPDVVCSQMLVGVEAGGSVVLRVSVPADLADGTYRVAVRVGRDLPQDETVASDEFRVVRPS